MHLLPLGHSLSLPPGQLPQSPQNCTNDPQKQALWAAFTQQLQFGSLLHWVATLHGLFTSQVLQVPY
jgi:hypothetical protein